MKIVIADDSSLMRERLKDEINLCHDVTLCGEASNGKEAFEMIKKINPDLVFMDIRMREMNGIKVLEKIRENHMRTKVCILTNYTYYQYKKRCYEAGADYFLNKTEDFEKISTVITDMLSNKVQHQYNQY
jgi:DNA-binding NarL/FixJ family response regulator